jgi:hypothetical protein
MATTLTRLLSRVHPLTFGAAIGILTFAGIIIAFSIVAKVDGVIGFSGPELIAAIALSAFVGVAGGIRHGKAGK